MSTLCQTPSYSLEIHDERSMCDPVMRGPGPEQPADGAAPSRLHAGHCEPTKASPRLQRLNGPRVWSQTCSLRLHLDYFCSWAAAVGSCGSSTKKRGPQLSTRRGHSGVPCQPGPGHHCQVCPADGEASPLSVGSVLLSTRGEEGTGSLQGWGVYQAFVLGPLRKCVPGA